MFTDEPDGGKKAAFDIAAAASSEDGTPLIKSSQSNTVRLSRGEYQKAVSKGIIYNFNIAIRKSGAYQMRIAVRDQASGKIGSASNFVNIPNLGKKRLALSGIALGNFTVEEWQRIQASKESIETEKAKNNTAFRSYKSGSILGFSFTIYNSQLDKTTKKPNLQSRVRIFREGKIFFEGNPKAVNLEGVRDFERIGVNNAISLGDQMLPGEYILEIVVTDTSAKAERAVATQSIDFEVIN